MSVLALNLFDLADNDDYRAYSRRSLAAVEEHGGRVVALGRLREVLGGDVPGRQLLILVEWPSPEAFEAFLGGHRDLHPLRESGTRDYLWWTYDRLEDLRDVLLRR